MISVIITVYKGERFINRAIASALNQSIKDLEIIVIDDCSPDDSEGKVLREFGELINKRIFYHRSEENRGPSYSRNMGVKLSQGEYIFFLDYDDEWEVDYVESSLRYLKEYSIVYSPPRTFINEDSNIIRVSKKKIPSDAEELIFSGYIGYPSASAFRRDAFLGYREDLKRREDWEIYIRSYMSGLKIKILDNNKVKIREHGKRISKNMAMLFDTMKVYEEYIDKVPEKYKKSFVFHVAEINMRFGNLPTGWRLIFKSLSFDFFMDSRKILTLLKRGFRFDRYLEYLKAKNLDVL